MFVIGSEDTFKAGKFPWVTLSLVLINVVLYTAQAFTGDRITMGYAMTPVEITKGKDLTKMERLEISLSFMGKKDNKKDARGGGAAKPKGPTITIPINHQPGPKPLWLTVVTCMFLHGDTSHLIGNLWFLVIFGRNVEGILGSLRFLIYYLVGGVAGNLLHIYLDPTSIVPCLGASGAISSVMGMYVSMFPFKKIHIWFGWLLGNMEFPALGVATVWFILQYVHGLMMMQMNIPIGVAYFVHIGGFVAGIILLWTTVLFDWLTFQPDGQEEDAGKFQDDAFEHAMPEGEARGQAPAGALATARYVPK